jgi:hypothetical protein
MIRHHDWVLCAVVMLYATAVPAQPDRPPRPPATTGVPSWTDPGEIAFGKTHYYLIRGAKQRMGRFDPDGNFVPYAESPGTNPNIVVGGPISAISVNACSDNRFAYEHRSGRLISGALVREPWGVFVPEIGSIILDLKKDYDPKKVDRRIYNLPEMMLRPSPVAPDPPEAGQPAGWRLVPFRDDHNPRAPERADPWFARVIGEVMELGHLSDEGEFVPDYGLPVFPYVKVKARDADQNGTGRSMYYTLPVVGRVYGNNNIKVGEDAEGVYEYRSGRLIPGTLQKTGNFVPDVGSKVIDFKEYDPDPPRKRRIYNLPGVLRPAK